jgi:hypothetical protein
MKCPGCGNGGRKDTACTHMTCEECHTVWCYVCGIAEKYLDKANPDGNIFSHNDNWKTLYPKRCPMFFLELHDID